MATLRTHADHTHLRELLARAPIHDIPRARAGFSHHETLGDALGWSSGTTEAGSDDTTRRAGAALLLLLLGAAFLRLARALLEEAFWVRVGGVERIRVGC